MATDLHLDSRYDAARRISSATVAHAARWLPGRHPDRLVLLANAGIDVSADGDAATGEPMWERAVQDLADVLSPDHPVVARLAARERASEARRWPRAAGREQPRRQFVLKVTSRCDLACDHCYVYDDPQQAWLLQPPRMEQAVAELAAIRIAEYADRHGLVRVAVILHGGEPLLLGPDRLFPLLAALRSTIEPVTELDLKLQSNGTLLTPRMCEGLVHHGVSVGVSLDGDRLANDRHRRYAHGGSSHSRVLRGLALLRTREFRSAYGGLLCTIDVANDPVRVYEALRDEAPPRIDFLLPHATWDRPP